MSLQFCKKSSTCSLVPSLIPNSDRHLGRLSAPHSGEKWEGRREGGGGGKEGGRGREGGRREGGEGKRGGKRESERWDV